MRFILWYLSNLETKHAEWVSTLYADTAFNIKISFVCLLRHGLYLCSSGCPGICNVVDQAGFKITEILLLVSPEC